MPSGVTAMKQVILFYFRRCCIGERKAVVLENNTAVLEHYWQNVSVLFGTPTFPYPSKCDTYYNYLCSPDRGICNRALLLSMLMTLSTVPLKTV